MQQNESKKLNKCLKKTETNDFSCSTLMNIIFFLTFSQTTARLWLLTKSVRQGEKCTLLFYDRQTRLLLSCYIKIPSEGKKTLWIQISSTSLKNWTCITSFQWWSGQIHRHTQTHTHTHTYIYIYIYIHERLKFGVFPILNLINRLIEWF